MLVLKYTNKCNLVIHLVTLVLSSYSLGFKMCSFAHSYIQKYMFVVIEGVFNDVENFSLNFVTHKNWYSLHSELFSVSWCF